MSKTAMHRRVLYALLPLFVVGCAEKPSSWPVAYDLVAGMAVADAWTETRLLDLATPRGRRHLKSGWSDDRWDRQRRRGFVVSSGDDAVLGFHIIEPRPMAVRFLAGPVDSELAAPVEIEVLINGNRVTTLQLEGRPRRHRVAVPEGLLRVGTNELTLRASGLELESIARARWYRLEFQFNDDFEPPLPFVTGDEDALMIPFGTRIEYTLRLPMDGVLTLDRLQYVGKAGGELVVVVKEDGRQATEIRLPTEPTESVVVALPEGPSRIARLSFRADHPNPDMAVRSGALATGLAVRSSGGNASESVAAVADSAVAAPPLAEMPNILLYVVDTLRADHLGLYGYDKEVSPALDEFASRATVFDNAVAQSSWTRAAMASIFTGLWPMKHAANGRKDILDDGATTLAEILSEAGYVTAAKVRNWNVFPVFGFRQGFQDYRRVREGKADRVHGLAEEWLRWRPQDRPFFLWVHTVDPHEPYRPPDVTREIFVDEDQRQFELDKHPGFERTREMSSAERQDVVRYLISLYDAEIAFNDRAFGDLVQLLEDLELLDSTVVIFVSDHGEEFLDHGTWGHGRNLYAENLNVPLVIRFPNMGHGKRVGEVVQQIDLMPTLLEYIGLPVPEGIDGRSMLPLLSAEPGPRHQRGSPQAFSYLHLDGAVYRSLVDDEWKLVQRLSDSGEVAQTGLFHRPSDPGEASNRVLEQPIRARFMELVLDAKMAEGSLLTTEEAILDAETEGALKALGYLQ